MMFGVPLERYAHDLDQLLAAVVGPARTVVMFELPTPPGHAAYTRIQRQLARQHAVALIPRRHLVAVLRDPAHTVDGVHLTDAGQAAMLEMVLSVLAPALPSGPGDGRYRKIEPLR